MESTTSTLEEFNEKYCKNCGSQLCPNVYDIDFRLGCSIYRREIMHQSDPYELLDNLNKINATKGINKNELAENALAKKILDLPSWLDGTCLVVSRDDVLDVINDYFSKSEV